MRTSSHATTSTREPSLPVSHLEPEISLRRRRSVILGLPDDDERRAASMPGMANTTTDERASADQVRRYAEQIRAAARDTGVTDVRLLDNGTLVIHSDDKGYRDVIELGLRVDDIVGTYVHIITDDAPAAEGARPL